MDVPAPSRLGGIGLPGDSSSDSDDADPFGPTSRPYREGQKAESVGEESSSDPDSGIKIGSPTRRKRPREGKVPEQAAAMYTPPTIIDNYGDSPIAEDRCLQMEELLVEIARH